MDINQKRLTAALPALKRLDIDTVSPAAIYFGLTTTGSGAPSRLIGSSYKCDLGEARGWRTGVQYLSPSTEAGITGFNPCAFAGACGDGCINTTGQMIYPTHVRARIKRTLRWYLFPEQTARAFNGETLMLMGKAFAEGLEPAIRGNGTSDTPFWLDRFGVDRSLPIQRYDYTKRPPTRGIVAAHQSGWHMTFSLSEHPRSMEWATAWQAHGVNVAMVVSGPRGSTRGVSEKVAAELVRRGEFAGRPIIDGDKHDLRFLDPAIGGWVVLSAKGGKAKRDESGFVVRFDPAVLLGTDWSPETALLSVFDRQRFNPSAAAAAK